MLLLEEAITPCVLIIKVQGSDRGKDSGQSDQHTNILERYTLPKLPTRFSFYVVIFRSHLCKITSQLHDYLPIIERRVHKSRRFGVLRVDLDLSLKFKSIFSHIHFTYYDNTQVKQAMVWVNWRVSLLFHDDELLLCLLC